MTFVNQFNSKLKTLLSLALMGLVCLGLGPQVIGASIHSADSYLAVDAQEQSAADLLALEVSPSIKTKTTPTLQAVLPSTRCLYQYAKARCFVAQEVLSQKSLHLPVLLRYQYQQVFSASDPDSAVS